MHQPNQESQQDAFNNTAYCGNKHCKLSTLYDHSTAASGSLVTGRRKKAFSKCHTIPKSSQLKDISSPEGKVIWIPMPPAENTSRNPKPYWMPGTLDEVLIFKGFCKNCDNDLFLKIDSAIERLDKEACFLLAFRAFSYTLWRNEVGTNAAQHLLPIKLSEHAHSNSKLPSLCQPTEEERQEEVIEHQNKRNQHLSIQNRFIESIRDKTYSGLTSLVIELDTAVPIRFSSAVPISYDFLGTQKAINWDRSVELPYIYVSLIGVGKKANLVFSYFDNVPNEAGVRFFNSVLKSMKRGTLSRDFHYYAVFHNMGFVANPAWFYSLPKYSLHLLGQKITEHTYGVKIPWHRSASGLLAPFRFFTRQRFGTWGTESCERIDTFSIPMIERLRNAIRIAIEDNSINFQTTPLEEQWLPKIFEKKLTLFKYCYTEKNLTIVLFYSVEMMKIAQRLRTSPSCGQAFADSAWQCFREVSIVVGDKDSMEKCEAQITTPQVG